MSFLSTELIHCFPYGRLALIYFLQLFPCCRSLLSLAVIPTAFHCKDLVCRRSKDNCRLKQSFLAVQLGWEQELLIAMYISCVTVPKLQLEPGIHPPLLTALQHASMSCPCHSFAGFGGFGVLYPTESNTQLLMVCFATQKLFFCSHCAILYY